MFRILVLLISLAGSVNGESIAQLKLMLQKKPGNPRILYHLARSHLQLANYSKSLLYFQKLHKAAPDHPEALPGIAISFWRLGREYEAYSTCRQHTELAGCSRIISTVRDLRPGELPVFELRSTLESTSVLDLERAESLISNHSKDPLFIDTLAQYFLDQNLLEFAFDFLSLSPGLLRAKAKIFQKIADTYTSIITRRHLGRLGTDESLFHAYYLWKFDPQSAERFPALALKEVRTGFEKIVQRVGFDTFENYYRLGFLYCLEKKTNLCRSAFVRADEKSPFELYSFLLRETLSRLENRPKTVKMGLAELKEFAPSQESFQKYVRQEKLDQPIADPLATLDLNREGEWYVPKSKKEFRKIIEETALPVYLQFCTKSYSRCTQLENEVLSHESLKGVFSGFIKVRLNPNLEPGKNLVRNYPVKRLPQVYFLGKGGSLLDEISGYFTAEELQSKLNKTTRENTSLNR